MSVGTNKPITAYKGLIFRVEQTTMPDGRVFEKAIRSPGTRIIIYDEKKDQILLSREFRQEIGEYDYRLPGGKVRDKIKDWDEIKDRADLADLIAEACKNEAKQEAGVELNKLNPFTTSTSGGPTIEWTLFYFVSTDFTELGKQSLEAGEDITKVWKTSQEAIELCLSGKMKEGRSAAALLQFFHSKGKI